MNGLVLLEIISYMSFIFSIFSYAFSFSNNTFIVDTLFLWIVFSMYGMYFLKKKNEYWYIVFIVMLSIPFIFIRDKTAIVFLAIICFFAFYIMTKTITKTRYGDMMDNFKKSLIIIAIFILFSLLHGKFNMLNKYSSSFMIIYIISSIILMRNLRYFEYNSNFGKINKLSITYSILIIGISFVLGIEKVRHLMVTGIKTGYNFIIDVLFKILYWAIIGIGYLGLFISNKVSKAIIEKDIKIEQHGSPVTEKNQDMPKVKPINIEWLRTLLKVLLGTLMIFLIVYAIIKLFKRRTSINESKEEYEEEKEFIYVKKKGDKRNSIIRPRNLNDRIRFYYRKFLKKCKKENIPILDSDTTLDVNYKANESYDDEALEKIREEYIKVRYGENPIDNDEYNKFYENYKKIK